MLGELFDALAAQDFDQPFEVCVTDDGSTDDTFATLEKFQHEMPFPVRVTRNETSVGPAAGRNSSAALATAPVLAFTDDDCRPDPGWLRAGVRALRGRSVVVGKVTPPEGVGGHPLARAVTSYHWVYFITSNVFYRREDFDAAGGFDTHFPTPGGEDTDLGFRVCKAGAEPRFEPSALVRHVVRQPSAQVALREAWRWHGIPRLVKKHPELRVVMFRHRVIWRESHQWMLLALLTLPFVFRSRLFLLGMAPWIWVRLLREVKGRRTVLRRLRMSPVLAAIDILEVIALVRGSVRDRTVAL